MKEQVELNRVASKIRKKLRDNNFLANLELVPPSTELIEKIDKTIFNMNETNKDSINYCLHFLLKIAVELNMLNELHELLELNLFKNIDQLLHFEEKSPNNYSSNGKTLLGLAAFHGHFEIVSYLVEVRMADVNAKDKSGDTPLHQVVYGDSHPFNHYSYGTSHDRVADCLLNHEGDLSVKNNANQTPYGNTKWCAPLKIENIMGRRFITNIGTPKIYYADKVRPVFEKELVKRKSYERFPVTKIGERKPQDFGEFCLDHAVKEYVERKKPGFGFSNIEEVYKALDSLPEEKLNHISRIIASQNPSPSSFKHHLISDQLSKIHKQSATLGLTFTLLTYYETRNILLSVIIGSLLAFFAWAYLTEIAYKQKVNERSGREKRVENLQEHDRFFKSSQSFGTRQIQELNNIQYELDQLSTNANELQKRFF